VGRYFLPRARLTQTESTVSKETSIKILPMNLANITPPVCSNHTLMAFWCQVSSPPIPAIRHFRQVVEGPIGRPNGFLSGFHEKPRAKSQPRIDTGTRSKPFIGSVEILAKPD
jgi:hypothetical protein